MSETQVQPLTAVRVPTVYFIDDSVTMREVIKIAFRKENIHVITCADAASAMEQFSEAAPDAVISDVIMPDKDGYQVCQFIKGHDRFGNIPVILMSGIVNQSVAEKAMTVKADELIRKPFQPQDLITRVKGLLSPKFGAPTAALDSIPFSPVSVQRPSSEALSSLFLSNPLPAPAPVEALRPEASVTAFPSRQPASFEASSPSQPIAATRTPATQAVEAQKLRNEIRRLELLVRKLQAELEASSEYCTALELHFKNCQESE